MKRLALLFAMAAIAVFAFSLDASAEAGFWERKTLDGTSTGTVTFDYNEDNLKSGEFISPMMIQFCPGSFYHDFPYECTQRVVYTNNLSRPITGKLTITSEAIKGGKVEIDVDLGERGDSWNAVDYVEFQLLGHLGEEDYFPEIVLTLDDEPQYVYYDTLRFYRHEYVEYNVGVGKKIEIETNQSGFDYTFTSVDEKIAKVNGSTVEGVADGDVYLKGHCESENAMWIYSDVVYIIHVGTAAKESDSDKNNSTNNNTYPYENAVRDHSTDEAITITPGYYELRDDTLYYCFLVENNTESELTATTVCVSDALPKGKCSEKKELTPQNGGEAFYLPLTTEFLERGRTGERFPTEISAVAEVDGEFTSTTEMLELSVANYTWYECYVGSVNDLPSDYFWLSSDDSIVSAKTKSFAALKAGTATLVGSRGTELYRYNVLVTPQPSGSIERLPFDLSGIIEYIPTIVFVLLVVIVFFRVRKSKKNAQRTPTDNGIPWEQ